MRRNWWTSFVHGNSDALTALTPPVSIQASPSPSWSKTPRHWDRWELPRRWRWRPGRGGMEPGAPGALQVESVEPDFGGANPALSWCINPSNYTGWWLSPTPLKNMVWGPHIVPVPMWVQLHGTKWWRNAPGLEHLVWSTKSQCLTPLRVNHTRLLQNGVRLNIILNHWGFPWSVADGSEHQQPPQMGIIIGPHHDLLAVWYWCYGN